MSSPQRNHLKENNSQKALEDYLSADLLNKVKQLKESLEAQTTNQTKLSNINNNENANIENTENRPAEAMLQQQTPFEMLKHCGLVDELNMYDQYVGQQLDSSSASSKTEEMPVSSNSPQAISQPASPNSEAGGQYVGGNVNNHDLPLNSSHNSGASGRQSACSTHQAAQNQSTGDQPSNQLPPTTSAVNVNILLNNVVNTVANSMASRANLSPSPAIAAQQLAAAAAANQQHQQHPNNSNLLSELSALMAAAAANTNPNSNRPDSANNNQQHPVPAQATPAGNPNANVNNPLVGLNGLNLLNSLTNASPINQIATLLASNAASSTVNQQMLLQQATNLGKVSCAFV